MTERELNLIRNLSNAKAPSGFEEEAIALVREALADICEVQEDSLRNLYLTRRANTGDKPLLMLDAHGDEVGFMIHSIRPEGTLRFVSLGGWNKGTLPGTAVKIRNRRGEWIPGVIAAKPPHFMSAEEKARQGVADYKDLVMDIGARSKEEAEESFGIRIGEPAVPATAFFYDEARDVMQGVGHRGDVKAPVGEVHGAGVPQHEGHRQARALLPALFKHPVADVRSING